jgi:hypothetical protein
LLGRIDHTRPCRSTKQGQSKQVDN